MTRTTPWRRRCNTGNSASAPRTLTCQGGRAVRAERAAGAESATASTTTATAPSTRTTRCGGACNTGLQGRWPGQLMCLSGPVLRAERAARGRDLQRHRRRRNGAVDKEQRCGGACVLGSAPGGGCDGNDADLCNEGSWQCSGLNAVVCSDATANNQETCNAIDDDCDGSVDEGTNACGGVCTLAHAPGGACDGGDTDVCNEGSWQCSGLNNTVCSGGTGNNVEVCDAIDQDCDGNSSEGPCTLTTQLYVHTAPAPHTCPRVHDCDSTHANCCELQTRCQHRAPARSWAAGRRLARLPVLLRNSAIAAHPEGHSRQVLHITSIEDSTAAGTPRFARPRFAGGRGHDLDITARLARHRSFATGAWRASSLCNYALCGETRLRGQRRGALRIRQLVHAVDAERLSQRVLIADERMPASAGGRLRPRGRGASRRRAGPGHGQPHLTEQTRERPIEPQR